jgi:hypothetical protein
MKISSWLKEHAGVIVFGGIIACVLIFWAGSAIYNHYHKRTTSTTSNSASSQPSSNSQTSGSSTTSSTGLYSNGLYTSARDGFSIQFPNTPSVTPSTDNFGYNSTSYVSTVASSGAAYIVLVDNFPSPNQTYFNGAVGGFEQNNTPVNIQNTTFEGYPAISGEFNDTQLQMDAYATLFYTNSQEYFIKGELMSQSTFDSFANSFKFTQ